MVLSDDDGDGDGDGIASNPSISYMMGRIKILLLNLIGEALEPSILYPPFSSHENQAPLNSFWFGSKDHNHNFHQL